MRIIGAFAREINHGARPAASPAFVGGRDAYITIPGSIMFDTAFSEVGQKDMITLLPAILLIADRKTVKSEK